VIARELTKAGVVRLSGTILDAGEVAVCSFGEDFQPYDDGCKLPSDGTYTVRLERIGANQSSPVPYTLYLQRRNDPADTLTVQLDQSLSGSLDRPMEIQSYAFSAKAGDLVVPRVDTSSDGTGPRVSFWDPGGADICLFGSLSPSEHWDSGCSLPTDGTYSVQVERDADEARQTAPVAYSLYMYRRYPPDAAKPITMGQTLTGSLVALLEVDSYTFDAKSGDSVVVMTRVSSGAGHLRATVWNPRNEALCTVYSDPMSLGPVCKLSSDGPYTIEVRGYGEQKSEAGPYTISLKQGEAS
jgi:hypothetical protein